MISREPRSILAPRPASAPVSSSLPRRAGVALAALLATGLFAACAAEPEEESDGAVAEQEEKLGEASSALQWNDCGNVHNGTGCNDAPVQACVCAADPYCCNVSWDSLCVSEVVSLSCVPPATHAVGNLACSANNDGATVTNPLPFVTVEIPGHGVAQTDEFGHFDIPISPLSSAAVTLKVTWNGTVTSHGRSTPLQVMDDFHNAHSEQRSAAGNLRSSARLDLDTVTLDSVDCELWRLGAKVLVDYHSVRQDSPPAGRLRIKRWNGVDVGTPYAFYDYIVIRNNFTTADIYTSATVRERTIFHEFAHTIRHAADGDLDHWSYDNFRWAYAREHDGDEITNVQFAFNEGWGTYWSSARYDNGGRYCTSAGSTCPGAQYRDWNELRVVNRLLDLAAMVGGDRAMVEVLEDDANTGKIHSLHDFEVALAAKYPAAPQPPPVAACPPGFNDDGATCSSSVSKPSYGRGAGTTPTQCGAGKQYDAGLCYPQCASGYYGVGPVCWQICPAGYSDDGLTCRRDAQIIGADNSSCPWYDKCGLTLSKGCSVCPPGYANDGCTCRIDAHIFGKGSYGRGAGTVPTQCGAGKQYDAGLCYPYCASGYSGAGPVCWGSCPAGYGDNGAICTTVIVQ